MEFWQFWFIVLTFFSVSIYGIVISFGIFVSALAAEKLAKGKNANILWGGIFWTILGGILGARTFHVIHLLPYYLANPVRIFAIWNGGLGIIGGILGGIIAVVTYLKFKKEPLVSWLNIAGVVTPLGQAIGRWGNFFNKEIVGKGGHPIFLYESILNFGLFAILYFAYKRSRPTFWLYLTGYSVIRFFLEFLRADPLSVWFIGGLNVVQVICAGIFLVAATVLIQERPKHPKNLL
ncbi:prolipoprotein diacylglyceryl transferase [bacterium]|nr:prolipoprotein diacylglyceryl transferase [bacterium]